MEAMLYDVLDEQAVHCNLCRHRCVIKNGARGVCMVRENQGGRLVSLVYGKVIAAHVDPIEKKPFYHFYPGSRAFSIATAGCNFSCRFCQNYSISQMARDFGEIGGDYTAPEDIVAAALKQNCKSISFTYTEPTVFFEYAFDIMTGAKPKGILGNFVSNGYMTAEAADKIAPYLSAVNVDLKAMDAGVYQKYCGAHLEEVLDSIKYLAKKKIWLEVTTLVIPTLNDDDKQLTAAAEFISALDPSIPWHVSRYHPDYKFVSAPPTPVSTLRRAREIGKRAGLRYVYTGNISGDEGENTFCHKCGRLLIKRVGFSVAEYNPRGGKCPDCAEPLAGIGL